MSAQTENSLIFNKKPSVSEILHNMATHSYHASCDDQLGKEFQAGTENGVAVQSHRTTS